MKQLQVFFFLFAIFIFVENVTAARVFYDGFESSDLSTSNEDGFSWAGVNRTSIVTQHPSNGNSVVYARLIVVNDSRDWRAKTGDNAMRFRYVAGAEMTEQRFTIGAAYTDLWIRYWIRVPVNYDHGTQNNKFLSLWVGSDGYDTYGTVTWQTRPSGDDVKIVYQDGGVLSGETGGTLFIRIPEDRGKWMQVVVRVKSASGEGTNDGIIQLYRRWDGESNWTKLHEKLNADTWRTSYGTQGISHGYLMGWANDPYDVDTEWLLDDFELSTTSLLDDIVSNAPSAPDDFDRAQ